jgi:periplasmic protein CpxP/Spy
MEMRKSLCSLALSGLLAVAGSAAFAQSDNSAPQPSAAAQVPAGNSMAMKHQAMTPDRQAAHLTKELQLTADQENQIKPILADRQQQFASLRQDQSLSKQDKMAKMKTLRDDSNAKIEAVLNDTQKQKFEQMQTRQQENWQQKKQGGETGAAPANSPS